MAETKLQNPKAPAAGQNQPFSPDANKRTEQRGKRQGAVSEYKKSLKEKQAMKEIYGLSERQFKKYVLNSLEKMQRVENVSDELVKYLEKRLDNVVFRLGFAKTRRQARQLVSHAFFTVNGKSVNIPSFQVSKGDVIGIKEQKKKKLIFSELAENLKKGQTHAWLKLDQNKLEAEAIGVPNLSEVNPPVEISLIFEFYSR